MKQVRNSLIPLKPVLVSRVWGGKRLKTEWGYESEKDEGLGECWAVSCNQQVDSLVTDGFYSGKYLSQLWKEEPQIFGKKEKDAEFPLLVKIIDAKGDLSIQVHPDDAYAGKHEHSKGKRECWYILDCPENAELIVGNNAKDREEFNRMIKDKRWGQLLKRIPVKPGDFLQIEPGTLHAITSGVELLEVQQNSDVTYRIYDYDRQENGKPRELHLRQGMDVAIVPDMFSEKSVIHTAGRDNLLQKLVSTPDYTIWTIGINGVASIGRLTDSFLICSVIKGSGRLNGIELEKGMHFIVPNGYPMDRLEGKMRINLAAPVYD